MQIKMFHHLTAVNDVLQDLAGDWRERDWSVVYKLSFVSFLEDGDHPGFFPIRWYVPSIQASLED